jgi:hypothetical protein
VDLSTYASVAVLVIVIVVGAKSVKVVGTTEV